jgi:release factor glutamine methyltransferase
LRDAVSRLAAAGIENPRLDVRVLWNRANGDAAQFESAVSRRAAREPLAYITGRKEFWSLDFEVGPGVLIPRPETETIIEQALAFFPERGAPLKVLDLGTGTACLPVAFLKEFPNAHVLGIDRSEEARFYALRNVARHVLAGRCEIIGGDWDEAVAGPYDVVLSNPPYIKTADLAGLEPEVGYEPPVALDGGPDGLSAYRALAPALARLLSPSGHAFFEIGAGQSAEVGALLAQCGLIVNKVATDLAGIPRVLVVGREG